MSDHAKDCRISVKGLVSKHCAGIYEAHCAGAAGPCVKAVGSTPKEAKERLAERLAWLAHLVPQKVQSGDGRTWLVFPAAEVRGWNVYPTDGSKGCHCLVHAPRFSDVEKQIKGWWGDAGFGSVAS